MYIYVYIYICIYIYILYIDIYRDIDIDIDIYIYIEREREKLQIYSVFEFHCFMFNQVLNCFINFVVFSKSLKQVYVNRVLNKLKEQLF